MQIAALQVAAAVKSFQKVVDFVIEVEGVKPNDFTTASTFQKLRKKGELVILTLEVKVQEVTQPALFSLHYRL